jgi:hypothetical protein
VPLAMNGPGWQVMRPSRNRYWGHPQAVHFVERLAKNAKKIGWNGLLIGDIAQPRGGPMLADHSSHQNGLDVDVWFTPMPDHVQSRKEREFTEGTEMVTPDQLDVDRQVWTPTHAALIRPPPKIRWSCACWSTLRSKRRYAATLDLIARGFTRCVPGMATPSTFTCRPLVRKTVRTASHRRRPTQTMAARPTSISGSRNRRCIRRRQNRSRR